MDLRNILYVCGHIPSSIHFIQLYLHVHTVKWSVPKSILDPLTRLVENREIKDTNTKFEIVLIHGCHIVKTNQEKKGENKYSKMDGV